jgi:hypothetical protein
MDFETEYFDDCSNGNGFLINDKPFADIDKKIRPAGGPRSPLFGTTFGDDNEFMDRYRCECGEFIGAQFEGEICPKCKTVIQFKEVDIRKTGWLNFYPYKIINPLYYQKLQSALSKKNLEGIISNENIITPDGRIRKHDTEVVVKKTPQRYYNIGLKMFYDNFVEIMEYYKTKRKMKADLIDDLIEERKKVWTSKLPVYSTSLRPQAVTVESYYFSPIDKEIHPLTSISLALKTATDIEVPLYLYSAQMRANKLWGLNFSLIDGKHGWLRGNVLGGSFNYSSRSVIVLDPTLKMDEVDIPYKSFIVMYNGLIVRELMNRYGWSITKSYNYVKEKFTYDEDIYDIICHIIRTQKPAIILNRNPTINWGSILKMRIRQVKPDSNDLTLAIPSAILAGLNADFDGDVLNIIALLLKEVELMFEGFEPTNMIIDRVDGSIRMDLKDLENIAISMFSFK